MTDKQNNRDFLLKYCNIMVNTLHNNQDQERMKQWLEAVTSGTCDEDTSNMYLELILWALHTDRVNVFPFKYSPPVDPGEVNDAYKYALEIVQFEPEENVSEKCGQIKTIVTDDLKEYLAVQTVPGFGTHCFYAFSDNAALPRWNMPPDMSTTQNGLTNDPKYWMTLFSRPEATIKEICSPIEEEKEIDEDEEDEDDGKSLEESEKSVCPDLCKVQHILDNLSFGGKKPQNIRSLIDEDDPECNKRKSSFTESNDKSSRSRKSSGGSDTDMSGESYRKSGESNRRSGENNRKSGESNRQSGEINRKSGESNRQSGENKREIEESNRRSGESNRKGEESDRKSSIKNTEVKIDSFLLSVDYPKNKFSDYPSSKKQEKKRKNVPPKTQKNTRPRPSSYSNWRVYSPDICSLDSDQFTCKEDKSPSWAGYDVNTASYPDDSTTVLCGDSLTEDNDYVLMNIIQHNKYRQETPTSSRSNRPSHQANTPRSSQSYRNYSAASNGRTPQSNGRFSRDRTEFDDDVPSTRRLRDDPNTFIPNTPRRVNNLYQRTPNYTRSYDRRSSDQNSNLGSLPSSSGRYKESKPQRKYIPQEVSRGCPDNQPTNGTSRTSLTNSIRSQRRLHFSEVHVEPQQHRPNIFADTPLKPCLRKSSDESRPSEMSDYSRSQRTREFMRNEDQCLYPRSLKSTRGSSPNNYSSGNR